MDGLIVLVGAQEDRVLGYVERSLTNLGREVLWLTNLAEVALTIPIANSLDAFRIAVGGKCWTLDRSSALLLADPVIFYPESQEKSIATYRWAETYAAWLTLLALFPGRAINRPSTVAAPIYRDSFLTRSVARAIGIPTIPETIRGPGRKSDSTATLAASDLASGISFWRTPTGDCGGSILSLLDYPPDALHYCRCSASWRVAIHVVLS